MAARESTFLNMVLTLLLVALVASLALGFVHEWTREPIEHARLAKQQKAIRAVVPAYDNDPVGESYKVAAANGKDSLEFFPARREGTLVATAVRSFSPEGYSGDVWLMVGLAPDGAIQNIVVVQHAETPGLGSKMTMPAFINQFIHVNPGDATLQVKKDGGQVDAISGATITSRAFVQAVQRAYDTYMKSTPNDGNED